jgi:hypothetical protein
MDKKVTLEKRKEEVKEKRKVGLLTKKETRKVSTSLQTRITTAVEGHNKDNRKVIVGFLPADKPNCRCANLVLNEKKKMSLMTDVQRRVYVAQKKVINCPRHTEKDMSKYKIVCKNCGELLGYVHATDTKLTDWCNFHYVVSTDGKEWFGGLTPNINPTDKKLGIECSCGVDTRNPKANGRDFGKKDSVFKLERVK